MASLDQKVKPRVKSDGPGGDLANQKMSMNPFDEIACGDAVRLKEAELEPPETFQRSILDGNVIAHM